MNLLLAVLGMLACIEIMAVVMPLGVRVARGVRHATAGRAPDRATAGAQDPPSTANDGHAGEAARADARRRDGPARGAD
jgi:hypothetical protein